MANKMKVNSCEGTFQGVYVGPNREITESAPWPSRDQAVEAIQFHHKAVSYTHLTLPTNREV